MNFAWRGWDNKHTIMKHLTLAILFLILLSTAQIVDASPKKIILDRTVKDLWFDMSTITARIDRAKADGFEVYHFELTPQYINGVRNQGKTDYAQIGIDYAESKGMKTRFTINWNKWSGGDRDKFRTTPADQTKFYEDFEWVMQHYPKNTGIDIEELQANLNLTKNTPTLVQPWKDFTNGFARKTTAIVRKYKDTSDLNKFIWSASCASSVKACPDVGFDVQTLDNEKLFNAFLIENNGKTLSDWQSYLNAWESGTENEVIISGVYATWTSLSTDNPACSPLWGVPACWNQGIFDQIRYAKDNNIPIVVFTLGYLNYSRSMWPNDPTPGPLAHYKVAYIYNNGVVTRYTSTLLPTPTPTATATPIPTYTDKTLILIALAYALVVLAAAYLSMIKRKSRKNRRQHNHK